MDNINNGISLLEACKAVKKNKDKFVKNINRSFDLTEYINKICELSEFYTMQTGFFPQSGEE